jgi:UDP-2,4-diacetamido-2,4,6-trideoxy-beta-L-altropyranose hydrolase
MKIGFRVDSSYKIGTGHVNRCLTLAETFKKKGINSIFISRVDKGNINKSIEKSGFKLVKIRKKEKNIFYDYNKTNSYIHKFKLDLIFIDNNFINLLWEKKISEHCKIILLTDHLSRKTSCDFLINYHNYKKKNYNKHLILKKKCVKFYGPKYSIIKPIKFQKKTNKKIDIFIFMGGVDNNNTTSRLISILKNKEFYNFRVKVMIGEKNSKKNLLINSIKNEKNFSYVYGKYKNLYKFFKLSKFVIINAGVSMYECLAFGNKTLVISQSETHKNILKNYSGTKMINYVENIFKLKKKYLLNLINKKGNRIIQIKKKQFDTKGSLRLANYFSSLKSTI